MSGTVTELAIEYVPVEDLVPDPRNPREITAEELRRLRRGIEEFGLVDPFVARREDGLLVGGHQRLKVARELGHETVPVVFLEGLSDDRAAALNVLLNNPNAQGSWDLAKLGQLLDSLDESDFDLTLTGFDLEEVEHLLHDLEGPLDLPAEDTVPRPPKRPKSKVGEIYELGAHRLICGDARDPATLEHLLDGEPVDFVFTSPPYNVGVQYDEHDDKERPLEEYIDWLRVAAEIASDALRPGRCLGWNVGVSPKTAPHHHATMLETLGLFLFRQFVWKKIGVPVPTWYHTRDDPRARRLTSNYIHELVYLFAKGELEAGGSVRITEVLENDVFSVNQSMATREVREGSKRTGAGRVNLERRALKAHPAVFPVALPFAFAGHMTDQGEVIYDPFAGSGTTLIATEKLGGDRRCMAVEIDPAYCDVTRLRYAKAVGRPELEP